MIDPLQPARDRANQRDAFTVYNDNHMHIYHADGSYCIDIYNNEQIIKAIVLTPKEFKELGNKLFLTNIDK